MSHHFTTGGADSSKGDFLPSPSGGPLVRFLGPEFVLCIAQSSHEFTWRLRTGFAYASTIAPWILQIGLVFSWSWYCLYCVCFFRILCCSTGSFIPTRLRKDIQTVGEELGYAHPSAGQLRFGRVWQSLMWNDMQTYADYVVWLHGQGSHVSHPWFSCTIWCLSAAGSWDIPLDVFSQYLSIAV